MSSTLKKLIIGSQEYDVVDTEARADVSTLQSDVSALQGDVSTLSDEIANLNGGAPTPAATVSAMADTTKIYLYTGSETGYNAGHWYYYSGGQWVDGGQYGEAASMSAGVKAALLACFQKVAWIDENGQTYYDNLYNELYPPANLVSITAVYTQSGTVYDTDTLDSLKTDLVVTAHYSDSTTQTITAYTLSGTLAEGTSTVTVSYGGKQTTFTVTVVSTLIASWDMSLERVPDSSDGITTVNNGTNSVVFTSGEGLVITGGTTNTDYVRFTPTDAETASTIIEEFVFKVVSVGNTSANISFLASNGTDGCNVIAVDGNICYYDARNRTTIQAFTLNTEHTIRIEYTSGSEAKVYLDGVLILTQPHSRRSTYYTTQNRIGTQNNIEAIIKSMKWMRMV